MLMKMPVLHAAGLLLGPSAYTCNVQYTYDCSYVSGDECPPYVDGPPIVHGYGDFHRFDHLHDHPMHVGHGFGAFGGHGFAGHGGFAFSGHGGVGRG